MMYVFRDKNLTTCDYMKRIEDPAWKAGVIANVTLVMHHPALLGYYICDDCCPVNDNWHNVALQARLAALIKSIDAYHITTGAVQCAITWPWTDVQSNPALPPSKEQPALQLSLDYTLVENYGALSIDHIHDSGLRAGNKNGAICNCNGLWNQHTFDDYPAAPQSLQSVMWLGVVLAEMSSNMVFVLESAGVGYVSALPKPMKFGWRPFFEDSTVPGKGWPSTIQVPLWGAKARQLAPSFDAPFGTTHPNATVTKALALRSGASQAGITGGLVRARAWAEAGCSSVCVHVIVVNIDDQSPVSFSISLLGISQRIEGSDVNASLLFDLGYNVTLREVTATSAVLSDFVAADATNIYEIGCHGDRPAPPKNCSAAVDWRCASRRVLCKHGFVEKDPNNATCVGA